MRLLFALLGALALFSTPAAAAVFTVSSTGDGNDATPGNGTCATSAPAVCTLRAAIQESNALIGADEVTVPKGEYLVNAAGDLAITSTLTVTAPAGARETTVNLNGNHALTVNAAGGSITITGLSLTNYAGGDAAVRIADGEVAFSAVNIHDNATTNGTGGGMHVYDGKVQIMASAITDNVATSTSQSVGGGIYNQAELTVTSSTIARNTARATDAGGNAFGGGISSGSITKTTLRHVTMLNNVANGGGTSSGGNLYTQSTTTAISDSILAGGTGGSYPQCRQVGGTFTTTGKSLYSPSGSDCAFAPGTFVTSPPALTGLGDHGGPGLTAVPQAGSPALNAAGECPASGMAQRGMPAPSGAGCDIGAAEASSDLIVTMSASAASVQTGEQVAFVAKVVNNGLDPAAINLTLTPPAGDVQFVAPSAGTCAAPAACSVGSLGAGQSASVTVVVRATAAGSLQASAAATGDLPDPTTSDATAALAVTVTDPPPNTTPADTTAPVLGLLGPIGKLTAGKDGTVGLAVSEPARVTVAVERLTRGRRVGGKCRAKAKRGKRCTITRMLGSLTAVGSAGAVNVAFPTTVAGRKITAGRYRLTATAVDAAGNASTPVTKIVRVAKARRPK
jgi:CSLREA domain-containing protein